jgi:hypothetical protein
LKVFHFGKWVIAGIPFCGMFFLLEALPRQLGFSL